MTAKKKKKHVGTIFEKKYLSIVGIFVVRNQFFADFLAVIPNKDFFLLILGCWLWPGLDCGIKGFGPIMSNFFCQFFQFFMAKKKKFLIFYTL